MLNVLEQNNAILAELRGKLNKLETSRTNTTSNTTSIPLNRPLAVAVIDGSYHGNPRNASGERNEIHQLKDMIKKLRCEFDARKQSLVSMGARDDYTASIAAFSEVNNRDTPKFLKEICRVENSVTDKLVQSTLGYRRNRPRLQSNQTIN